MSFTVYIGIGMILVLAVIGFFVLFRHDSVETETYKRIYLLIGSLQAAHIILYLTGLLDKLNVYLSFEICAIISVVCIVMSGWMLLSPSKFKHGIKYLFMLLAIVQVISTIMIFLLPDAGIPPLIQF